jgi:hypothetical protein
MKSWTRSTSGECCKMYSMRDRNNMPRTVLTGDWFKFRRALGEFAQEEIIMEKFLLSEGATNKTRCGKPHRCI